LITKAIIPVSIIKNKNKFRYVTYMVSPPSSKKKKNLFWESEGANRSHLLMKYYNIFFQFYKNKSQSQKEYVIHLWYENRKGASSDYLAPFCI